MVEKNENIIPNDKLIKEILDTDDLEKIVVHQLQEEFKSTDPKIKYAALGAILYQTGLWQKYQHGTPVSTNIALFKELLCDAESMLVDALNHNQYHIQDGAEYFLTPKDPETKRLLIVAAKDIDSTSRHRALRILSTEPEAVEIAISILASQTEGTGDDIVAATTMLCEIKEKTPRVILALLLHVNDGRGFNRQIVMQTILSYLWNNNGHLELDEKVLRAATNFHIEHDTHAQRKIIVEFLQRP